MTASSSDQRSKMWMRTLKVALGGAILLVLGGGVARQWTTQRSIGVVGEARAADGALFTPPSDSAIPDGPDGDAIRHGQAIFDNPLVEAAGYVGNSMACRNCHLDAGRKAFASPMWAAWLIYPKYRAKNGKVMTMEERIRDCFIYSQNAGASPSGGPPPLGSPIYADLQTYFHWLATGAPTGATLEGAGYKALKPAPLGYDRTRGEQVYAENCTACHGTDGQGIRDADGHVLFPPLWGAQSFNWGAGMARIDRASAFIKANMPLGADNSLTDQQAWDVAAWIDSHERPRDPRQTGTVAQAAQTYHANEPTYYGQIVEGHLLGTGAPPAAP